MDIKERSAEAGPAIWKTVPPWAAVATDKVLGLTLNDWVMIAALVYTVLQIIVLIRKNFFSRSRRADD